jgi:hypothetical protein
LTINLEGDKNSRDIEFVFWSSCVKSKVKIYSCLVFFSDYLTHIVSI